MISDQFDEGRNILEGAFLKTMREKERKAWWNLLKGRDGDLFIASCRAIASNAEKFPTLSEVRHEMRQKGESSAQGQHCIRCDRTGFIPFFQFRTVLGRQHGSIVSGRCSCPAGDRLAESIPRFDDLFPLEAHRTYTECRLAAWEAEDRWLREKHWPRLYTEVTEGVQKRELRKLLSPAVVEELEEAAVVKGE